ncbi:MAG: hypothetical protein H7062_19095 [Candidatus Saccharimonas sp.]|nr:hypothetical protein [Planctomycetaceae bacterium]
MRWDETDTALLLQPGESLRIIGRKADDPNHYGEFRSVDELLAAGFIELGDWEHPYRLESWAAYQRQKPPF